MQKKEE